MRYAILLGIGLLFGSCTTETTDNNVLTKTEVAEGWKLLFDGQSTKGWHLYNKGDTASKWIVSQGELICDPHKKDGIFGDLITDQNFKDFELTIDWKVGKGGNSGVLFNVNEQTAYAATFATGLEMQLLDNAHAEKRHQVDSSHWAGCLYAVDCIAANSKPKAFGEWNTSRIVQQNGLVSFWLNGLKTYEEQTLTPAFKEKIKLSGMKAHLNFAKYPDGKIALQNHTDSIAFRNIKIRAL